MRRSSGSVYLSRVTCSYADPRPFLGVTHVLRELAERKEPYAMLLLEIACPGHRPSRIEDSVFERLMQLAAQRTMRTLGDCIVARIGTDRIVVLLEGPVDERLALSATGRLHDALRAPFELGRQEFHLTTSIGVGLGEWHTEAATVLAHSERALERVKANGGDATAVEGQYLVALTRGHIAA
jgi:predicted signal transduction protein with EAL and GGDEF domain